MKNYDVIVVGGGIVGAATFYKMQKRYPRKEMLLIDKMSVLADHQTGNNSGVIHSGLYYKPGSLKAENCVKGRHELVSFAKEYNVPHDVCGKVVVAVDSSEMGSLNKIHALGIENKIEGIELINSDQLRDIEPECRGEAALWVPCTGIIDFREATKKMVEVAIGIQPLSAVHLSEEVLDFNPEGEGTLVTTSKAKYFAKHLIVCGGLQADRLAIKDGVKLREKVVGFRGDYYELNDHAKHKVRNLIYPVPNPDFPFLGVHFTRMTNGEIECGPNAVFTFKREGYGKTDFNLRDTVDALGYSGTWKLFFNNMSFGINEYRRAFSKRLFLKTLQHLVPSLTMDDIRPGRSGVRAMLLNRQGDTGDDFRIETTDRSIHVLNAPSPAATASLAIGDYVADRYAEKFG
ncbi:MAG TPA: L-2-hydroxyglutarate oxidase [Flavobacteriales bacterium]|jgi:L-2-hydroxyglutarate oxidase|nr:L-2-hydroxyglutarate oxidase [Flavobacteriales bacterium]HIB77097.1 L-2-hydroxyglutarate oxidase [Flavobacteriales bacterium]HIO59379.1 L-2-hydroxyglutarate oxidase [Flavobacteriales bacterium]